jgi:hypothetical protein
MADDTTGTYFGTPWHPGEAEIREGIEGIPATPEDPDAWSDIELGLFYGKQTGQRTLERLAAERGLTLTWTGAVLDPEGRKLRAQHAQGFTLGGPPRAQLDFARWLEAHSHLFTGEIATLDDLDEVEERLAPGYAEPT